MIAARQFQDFGRNLGGNAFDLPVAALAGLAAAVVAFVIPGDLLGQMVDATGLPSLLAAAEPPLGFKARAAIGIFGALVTFGLVFLLLRRLDRPAPRREEPQAASRDDVPKLRRRDVHPDAPPRRPISAARDFGEPAPPPIEEARAPTPVWLDEADAEELVLAPAPAAEASLAELMERLERGLAHRRTRQAFVQPPQPQAPQVFPEAGEDRLQSAIQGLQRLAARGD